MTNIIGEIWAVALRDLRKKETFLKYLVGIILVAVTIMLIGLGFDTFIDFSQYGSSYSQFFSSGIIIFYIVMIGLQTGVELVTDKNGFLKLMLVTPVSKYSILFGKIISGFITSLKTFFFVIIVFLFLFKTLSFMAIIEVFLFMLFITIVFHSFGLWLSSLFKNRDSASSFVGWFSFVMLFLSGIFYPIEALPNYIKFVFYLNPMTYTVDVFRFIMGGTAYFPIFLSLVILISFGLVSIFLGTYQFDKNLRK